LSKKLNVDKNSDQPHNEKGRFLPISETVSENGNEKEKNDARKEAIEKRWKPEQKYLSETVSDKYNEEQEDIERKGKNTKGRNSKRSEIW
jgi:23S rRNA maturation mini-RNase III